MSTETERKVDDVHQAERDLAALREAVRRGGCVVRSCQSCGVAVVCRVCRMPLCEQCRWKLGAEAVK